MAPGGERRACPRCGLATARVEGDLVLCGACGAVERADGAGMPPAGPPREEWMLELLAGDERPALSRRAVVARGVVAVACVEAALVSGLVAAFRAFGEVNVRYVGALAALVALVGTFAVAAVAWAAGDPNSPLRDRPGRDASGRSPDDSLGGDD